jgi:transposase-like protein
MGAHKTANVLDKLPKRVQPEAKSMIHDIWMADTRKTAEQALERFCDTYEAKSLKATHCLSRDRDTLLTFYDFPAAHWQHLPVESAFATIRLRTVKTRNCLSVKTALTLVHQLAMSAKKHWRRLWGFEQLADRSPR